MGGRLPSGRVRGGPRGHSARHQGPASLPGTGPGTWSMTSRAWPGNQLPWGPALLPDTNQSLLAEADWPALVSGAQQTPAPRAACKAGEPAPTHLPLAGEDRPGHSRCLAPTVSHSHTHTHTVTPVVTSHPGPRTGEHTGTQSAHGPQGGVITVGWAPGAHRPGKAVYGPGAPSSRVPSGCWGPCVTQEPAQAGRAEVPIHRGERSWVQRGQVSCSRSHGGKAA